MEENVRAAGGDGDEGLTIASRVVSISTASA
jgi:hypothetical protein